MKNGLKCDMLAGMINKLSQFSQTPGGILLFGAPAEQNKKVLPNGEVVLAGQETSWLDLRKKLDRVIPFSQLNQRVLEEKSDEDSRRTFPYMFFLHLFGGSGVGKTTLSSGLGEWLGLMVVNGDAMALEYFIEHPRVAKEVFGQTPEAGENGLQFVMRCCEPTGDDKIDVRRERDIFYKTIGFYCRKLRELAQLVKQKTDLTSHDFFGMPHIIESISHEPKDENGKRVIPNGIVSDIISGSQTKLRRSGNIFAHLKAKDEDVREEYWGDRLVRQGFKDPAGVMRLRNKAYPEFSPKAIEGIRMLDLTNNYEFGSFTGNVIETMHEAVARGHFDPTMVTEHLMNHILPYIHDMNKLIEEESNAHKTNDSRTK